LLMFKDEDFIQISGLQHLSFCRRRWALIHIDQEWEENYLTADGRNLHQRVDQGYCEFRKGLRQYSGLYVKSIELGIFGRTDLVEAVKTDSLEQEIVLFGLKGLWELYPVEFKRGKAFSIESDSIQLCAQALCLEEMTGSKIQYGAIFYGQTKKRIEVTFSEQLRMQTKGLISLAHKMLESGAVPPPDFQKHCYSCSLFDICLPDKMNTKVIRKYRQELLGEKG